MRWGLPSPERYSEEYQLPTIPPRELITNNVYTGLEEGLTRRFLIRNGRHEEADAFCPGLCINGGGSATAWSAGEAIALAKEGLLHGDGFRFVMGTSAGALVIMYAALQKFDAVKIFTEDLPHGIMAKSIREVRKYGGLIDYKKLEEILREGRCKLSEEDLQRLRHFPIPLLVGATVTEGPDRGKVHFYDLRQEKDPIPLLIATMKLRIGNIPDVILNGTSYADGGLGEPIPTQSMSLLQPTSMTILFNSPITIGKFGRWKDAQQARIAELIIRNLEIRCMATTAHRRTVSLDQIHRGEFQFPCTVLFPDRPTTGIGSGIVNSNPLELEAAVRDGSYGIKRLLNSLKNRLDLPDQQRRAAF